MIKCYIYSNLKKIDIYINEELKDVMSFEDLRFKKESTSEDKAINVLKMMNKLSVLIKLKYEAKETDTTIVLDNDYIYKLLKPNDSLIAKLTKSMKKNIKNNELKLLLGSTLYEMSTIQNIQIEINNKNYTEEEDNMLKNKNKSIDTLEENNLSSLDFNSNKESDFLFDLEDDFSFDLNEEDSDTKDEESFSFDLNEENNEASIEEDFSTNLNDDNEEEYSDFSIDLSEDEDIEKKDDTSSNLNIENEDDTIIDSNFINLEQNDNLDIKIENKNITEEDENTTKESEDNSMNLVKNKNSDLKSQLVEEFAYIEKYIDEKINNLNKISEELKNEYESKNINIGDLSIDEEVIVENFKKCMEIRLRLKVIKNSCRIYTNMKKQLADDLSKI